MGASLKYFIALMALSFLISCGSSRQLKKTFDQNNESEHFFRGFVLYNPKIKKEIINYNGTKGFTPASNTKLYTFYTAYKTFNDSVPSLAYYKKNDSLIIKGTADPSFLYGFNNEKVVDFLKNESSKIYLLDLSIDENPYGSGWAWDDYQDYYMPEKSLFPMYGNVLKYSIIDSQISSIPAHFSNDIKIVNQLPKRRSLNLNKFFINENSKKENTVPFITSNSLVATLLSNQIKKNIQVISSTKKYNFKHLYSVSYDDLYKKMLIESDNFIAEQLMLQVGYKLSNKYSVKEAIRYSLDNYLDDLPQKPRWVDGSGLSRYNLFSPNDMIFLLNKMYSEIPFEKLISYFPVGGKTGTLKSWYGNDKPYVYAKSGSLSNNYNLSGYLITKKGTVLIFSYMNNHYTKSTSLIKKEIEITLKRIYDLY